MTELALSDERKPLIFPPFHHQSGGEEVAVGAQTADDVICNRGPPVSGEGELLRLSTRGKVTTTVFSIQPQD